MSLPPNLRPAVFQARIKPALAWLFPRCLNHFGVTDGGLVIVILSEMEVREENNVENAFLRDGCASFSLVKGPT